MAGLASLPVAALLLYLIVRMNAPYFSPAIATVLPPKDPSVLARVLPALTADPMKQVSLDSVSLARRAALSAPLAFEPFFVQARAEERAGRLANAIRLMEEARRRRPSYDLTRIHLVAYYQQAGRYRELLAELDFILRRSSEAGEIILPELAKLMPDPRGRAALATILSGDPEWRSDFYRLAARQPGSAADARLFLELVRSKRPRGGVALEEAFYIRRLVQAGEYRQARAMWLQSLPPAERSKHALLFNGGLRRIEAPEPFGWTLRKEAQGRAEIVTTGTSTPYLDVVYYGGSAIVLAEQQLALEAGRHRFAVLGRSDQAPTAGQIYWRLTCLPGAREIGRVPLQSLQPQYRRASIEFSVPAGCSGQQLALVAEPGDIAAEVRLQLTGLELSRAN